MTNQLSNRYPTVWKDGQYVPREATLPPAPTISEDDLRAAVDEVVEDVRRAAIERGAREEDATAAAARFRNTRIRTKTSAIGTVVVCEVGGASVPPSLGVARLGAEIAAEAQKENAPEPKPATPAETQERRESQFATDPSYNTL